MQGIVDKLIKKWNELDTKIINLKSFIDSLDYPMQKTNAEEVLSLILADIINVFKESEAPKSLTKEMMNEIIDITYDIHPTHFDPEE